MHLSRQLVTLKNCWSRPRVFPKKIFQKGESHDKVLLSNTKIGKVGLLLNDNKTFIGKRAEIIHFIHQMGVDGSSSHLHLHLGGIQKQETLGVVMWKMYGVHLNIGITRLRGVSGSPQMDDGGENCLNRLVTGIGQDLVSRGGGL